MLNSHPDTLEVATVGMKDTFRGEIPVAFVVLKPGSTISAEDLLDYCKQKLVDYKIPRRIEFRDSSSEDRPRQDRQAEASRAESLEGRRPSRSENQRSEFEPQNSGFE